MNALLDFGINLDTLESQLGTPSVPVVPGRVAHIDADFMAYIVAADTRKEVDGEKPMRNLPHKFGQVKEFKNYLTRLVGAERSVLHVTPTGSNKGNRPDQAVQAEYQANRKGKAPPEHLIPIRTFMIDECNAVPHMDQEADDGLVQAMIADPVNTIIVSDDKDLRMCPGLHYAPNDKQFYDIPWDDFGKLWVDDSKSAKKVRGTGPAFFFLQLLQGDSADNIKGLPLVAGKTKAVKVGQMKAFELMQDVDNVLDAFHLVRTLFTKAQEDHAWEYKHWRTGEIVTPNHALMGDMQTLWMRRNKNPKDVIDWIKENM